MWRAFTLITIAVTLSSSVVTMVNASDDLLVGHIIAHSHCDPGWLDTFETYYDKDVRGILDGVTQALSEDPNKRFVWAEISFFNRWYEVQSLERKRQFKRLVDNGQIEFVSGGWVQNDEANPDFYAIMNQMTEGHQYLLRNFGVQPRVGWQIDPFGHSAVTPSLFALMGFDGLVINRIHFQIKANFKVKRHMEFIWRGVDMGTNTDLLTHVLHTHYSAVKGYDWEEGSMPVNAQNVEMRSSQFVDQLKQRFSAYRSRHMLVPFGDDFKFKDARGQFASMDQIIAHVNANAQRYGMRLQYSTPGEYFKALHESKTTFPVYSGDFFPYADNSDSYWSGYFTTRPMLKATSRRLEAAMRGAEILHALVRARPLPNIETLTASLLLTSTAATAPSFWENKFSTVEYARQQSGLFLHHDAITGTSRSQVVDDYMSRMEGSAARLLQLSTDLIEHVMTRPPNPSPAFTANLFTLTVLPSDPITVYPVVIFNTLGWLRKEVVTMKVNSRYVSVVDRSQTIVPSQIDPTWTNVQHDADPHTSTYSLSFIAELPPLGATTYFVSLHSNKPADSELNTAKFAVPSKSIVFGSKLKGGGGGGGGGVTGAAARLLNRFGGTSPSSSTVEQLPHQTDDLTIENDIIRVSFHPKSGLLKSVFNKVLNRNIDLAQTFDKYDTARSGAYIFRPNMRKGTVTTQENNIRLTRGPILNTLQLRYNRWDGCVTIVGGNEPELAGHIAFNFAIEADPNTEPVMSFHASLSSKDVFYTHNGLQFMSRTRLVDPIAGNFYPAVTGAKISEPRTTGGAVPRSFTIVSGHSMGCSSMEEGSLEFMIHRNLNQDDGRGLAQAVQDNSKVDIPFWLYVDDATEDDIQFRRHSIRLNFPPLLFFRSYGNDAARSVSIDSYLSTHFTTFTPLTRALPKHIHIANILSRDSISDDVHFRLQSLASSTANAKVWRRDLSRLLSPVYGVSEVRPASLTFNQRSHTERLTFPYSDPSDEKKWESSGALAGGSESQHTDEEGVFLSQAAMDKLKAETAASRKLLALPATAASPASSSLIELAPLQLKSYIARLSARSVVSSLPSLPTTQSNTPTAATVTVVNPPSNPSNGAANAVNAGGASQLNLNNPVNPSNNVLTPPIVSTPPSTPPSSSQQPSTQSVGRHSNGGARWRVIAAHSHSIEPQQPLPYWPDRSEVFAILILTLAVVTFYLMQLGVAHCGPTSITSPIGGGTAIAGGGPAPHYRSPTAKLIATA